MKFNHRNVFISPNASIGKNVKIGDNTTIYDGVEIGDNSIICNDCVLGEPLNSYYFDEKYENPPTKIGTNALVRSHTIIYAGSSFGAHFSCGHRVTIREQVQMGEHCAVGTQSDLQGYSVFGDYCRLHSNIFIAQYSKLGNFVFIYPAVVFANDPHPPSNIDHGPTIGDYTQIAANSLIFPMVNIGKHCLIGANTMVNKNFGDELLVLGSPAKAVSSVKDVQSREKHGQCHYPWMYHFERGMPWEGIGYDTWLAKQSI